READEAANNATYWREKARLTGEAAHIRGLNPQQERFAPNTPSVRQKKDALDAGDVRFLAKNEMVLYHRGRDIARYGKVADFNEVPAFLQGPGVAQRTVFVPGARIGRATVGGVPWGVEVCFDHNLGVLSNTPTEVLPRVHMLCSAA